ncbi:MAG: ubiquinol-cytochrome C chaperone family protein [Pseudomonadota bacterium]
MSFSVLKKIFSADPFQIPAHEAYVALVNQARKPFFYQECAVADTLDGRFDVIIIHVFMLTQRLKNDSQEFLRPEFIRAVWEVFFSDMDRSLREMGASDTGIGKRVKKMAQAFYGRIDSYEKTVANAAEFKESLKRNLYRGAEVEEKQISSLVSYVLRNLEHLQKQDITAIVKGELSFCD